LALIASLLLVVSVFSYALYSSQKPQRKVWEVKVFESYVSGDLRLVGSYDLEEGATYRITYYTTKRNWAEKVVSIERLD